MSLDRETYDAAMERAGYVCEFPGCTFVRLRLEVAHLLGKQAGGSKYRDVLENLIVLCTAHHDLLDGRMMPNGRRFEMEMLFRAAVGRHWKERR